MSYEADEMAQDVFMLEMAQDVEKELSKILVVTKLLDREL